MDGQNGGYRPRTAGERNGVPGPDSGVRDWQKNTWFGPAPLNSNPFDEPDDAPELRETRSENVNQHMGEFWMAPDQGNRDQRMQTGNAPRVAEKKKKAHPHALRAMIGILLFLTAVFLVLRFAVFSVKEIRVTGNNYIPAEEIIRVSGVRRGSSIFFLNEDRVKERIQADYRMKFRYVAREMPGTVVLSIREREPCCWLTYCGIMYVMDKDRMVLYESENPAEMPADLVEVKGLEVRSNTVVGQYINLGNEAQKSVFTELFLEMKVLGCTKQIAEADISNTDSILLTTRDGFTVGMGDRTNIHAKLKSMLLAREKLTEMGYTSGIIKVMNLETPIYEPN